VPYSSLESVIEQTKESYYVALRKTQGTIRGDAPDWDPWITYFLRALQHQKNRLKTKIEHERLMADTLPGLSVQIVALAKAHGKIKIAEVVKTTGANRNTVKKHLQSLVSARHLAQHGTGKGTWYSAA